MITPISKQNYSRWSKGCGLLILLVIGILSNSTFQHPNMHHRAKSVESRNTLGAMNRSQQAYFLEHNTFAKSLEALQIGIRPETQNYRYSTQSLSQAAFHYGISLHPEVFQPKPKILGILPRPGKEYGIPSYLGIVWAKPDLNADSDKLHSALTPFSILCQSTYPYLLEEGFQPTSHNGDFQCPDGMIQLN